MGTALPTTVSESRMLSVPSRLSRELLDHAERGQPAEVCGILGGRFDPDHSVVASVYEATNAADRPEIRYAIDPGEQLELMERIEDAGEDVVGFYHSHPAGPSQPSETDVDRATWPERSYVIVTGAGEPSIHSWRWNGRAERFEAEQITSP